MKATCLNCGKVVIVDDTPSRARPPPPPWWRCAPGATTCVRGAVKGITLVLTFTAFDVLAVVFPWGGPVAHWVHLVGTAAGIAVGLVLRVAGK